MDAHGVTPFRCKTWCKTRRADDKANGTRKERRPIALLRYERNELNELIPTRTFSVYEMRSDATR
jgi:hypothetical protein